MKRTLRWLVAVAAVAAVVVALRATVLRPDPVPVTVFAVERGRVEDTVTNSRGGTVETRRRASLGPEIAGRVAALPAREGQPVVAGDILLRLDDSVARAEVTVRERALETARATERQACLEAGQAERDLGRHRRLAEDDLVSPETLDQVQSRRDVAAAACEQGRAAAGEADAALDAARTLLAKTVVAAPFAGVVAELKVEVGEYVTPAPPGVYIPAAIDLIDPRDLYVKAPLDEVDVGRVSPGLPVRITMDPYADHAFAGRVTRVAPYVLDVEKQSRTFDVEVDFDEGERPESLVPGTSADVEIILEARDDVLRIPSYALMEGGQVLVVEGDRLEAVGVAVGLRNYAFAEVRGGLEAGDRVVLSLDRAEVVPGALARVESEAPR